MISRILSWYPSSSTLMYVTQRMKSGIALGLASINTGMTRSSLSSRLTLSKLAIHRGMHSDLDIDIALVDIKSTTHADDATLCSVSWRLWSGSSTFATLFPLLCKATLTLKAYFESHSAYNRHTSFLMFFFSSFGVGGNCKRKKNPCRVSFYCFKYQEVHVVKREAGS